MGTMIPEFYSRAGETNNIAAAVSGRRAGCNPGRVLH